MIKTFLNLFAVVANACTEFWRFLTLPLNDLFSEMGFDVPLFVEQHLGDISFGEILIGAVGLFLVITLVKWVVGIVL